MTYSRSSIRISIVADDLTSAMDGAVTFAKSGHCCEVRFDHRASSDSVSLFAPAFPAAGRTTEAGEQKLHGAPVHLTEFGRDPIYPIRRSDIRGLFPPWPDNAIQHLSLRDVRTARADSLHIEKASLLIGDAATQADLDTLVAAIARPRDILLCGSPGMAHALAARFPWPGARRPALLAIDRVLVVVGSANAVSAVEKAALLEPSGGVEIMIDAAAATSSPVAAARIALDLVASWLGPAATVIIGTTAVGTGRGNPRRITEAFALAATEVMRSVPCERCVLTGGETAAAVLGRLNVRWIRLIGELEPGIPLGAADEPRPMAILTKAGGFGSPDALTKAVALMRIGARDRAV